MHAADLAQMDYLRNLVVRLQAAAHGQQGKLIAEAMEWLGMSRPTVYSRLRALGYGKPRRLRSDKGDSRVSEDEVKAVAAIMRAAHRQNGKELLTTEVAMDIALANGRLQQRVSAETMLRLMRRYHCHPRQLAKPSPHTSMRSLHPNHVWQLDASLCVLYYLKNGRVGVMDERKFNIRKPRDVAKVSNQRVLRYALTDHTTGNVIARYYNVAGEDQQTLFEFLMWAFHPQPGRVMHGVPWLLVWDAGSANQSHAIGNLLSALMVRHWAHVPGNPRAKGQVEGVHDLIERKFEGRLTFIRINSVDELNGHLDTWLKDLNGNRTHTRHKHTRDGLWQTIRQDQLRLCPSIEQCRMLMNSKPVERTVAGNLTIKFTAKGYEPAVYDVEHVPGVRVGDVLQVAVNPYRAPSIFILGEGEDGATRYIECDPIATDHYGFFEAAPVFGERYAAKADTAVDTARRELNDMAYGERDSLDAAAARAKGRLAFNGEIDPFKDVRESAGQAPHHMQRRGTAIDLPNQLQVDVKPLNLIDALKLISTRLGRDMARGETADITRRYPDGVPEADLDALVQELHAPARPRLAVVS